MVERSLKDVTTNNTALGFSFFTLVLVLIFALSIMGTSVFAFLGFVSPEMAYVFLPANAILIALNLLIVYGLRRNKKWAIGLGAIEMLGLLLYGVFRVVFDGLSSFGDIWFIVLISLGLLFRLYSDYKALSERTTLPN